MTKHEWVKTKVFWKSKTFQVNTLLLVAALAAAFAGEIQAGVVLTVPAVINLILRTVTKTGVSLS